MHSLIDLNYVIINQLLSINQSISVQSIQNHSK